MGPHVHAVQFGNNWMRKFRGLQNFLNPIISKFGQACSPIYYLLIIEHPKTVCSK